MEGFINYSLNELALEITEPSENQKVAKAPLSCNILDKCISNANRSLENPENIGNIIVTIGDKMADGSGSDTGIFSKNKAKAKTKTKAKEKAKKKDANENKNSEKLYLNVAARRSGVHRVKRETNIKEMIDTMEQLQLNSVDKDKGENDCLTITNDDEWMIFIYNINNRSRIDSDYESCFDSDGSFLYIRSQKSLTPMLSIDRYPNTGLCIEIVAEGSEKIYGDSVPLKEQTRLCKKKDNSEVLWFRDLNAVEKATLTRLIKLGIPQFLRAQVWMSLCGLYDDFSLLEHQQSKGKIHEELVEMRNRVHLEPSKSRNVIGQTKKDTDSRGFTNFHDMTTPKAKKEKDYFMCIHCRKSYPSGREGQYQVCGFAECYASSVVLGYLITRPKMCYITGMYKVAHFLYSNQLSIISSRFVFSVLYGRILKLEQFADGNSITENNKTTGVIELNKQTLNVLVSWKLADLHEHFVRVSRIPCYSQNLSNDIEYYWVAAYPLSAVTESWFSAVLVDALPLNLSRRVWDMLLMNGTQAIFQASLAILYFIQEDLMKCTNIKAIQRTLQNTCYLLATIDSDEFADKAFKTPNMFVSSSELGQIKHLLERLGIPGV